MSALAQASAVVEAQLIQQDLNAGVERLSTKLLAAISRTLSECEVPADTRAEAEKLANACARADLLRALAEALRAVGSLVTTIHDARREIDLRHLWEPEG